jgi:hypothetical protein
VGVFVGFFGDGGTGWFRLALVPSLDACRDALAIWPAMAALPLWVTA